MADRANLTVSPHFFRDSGKKSFVTVAGQNLQAGDKVIMTIPWAGQAADVVDFWEGTLEGGGVTDTTAGSNPLNPPRKIYVVALDYKGVGNQSTTAGGVQTVAPNAALTTQRANDDLPFKQNPPPAPPPIGGHPPGSDGGTITMIVETANSPTDDGSGGQSSGASDPNPFNS